jgi:hypothetical protein
MSTYHRLAGARNYQQQGLATLAFTVTGLIMMTIAVLVVGKQVQQYYEVLNHQIQFEQSELIAESAVVRVQNYLQDPSWYRQWMADPDQDGWLGQTKGQQTSQYNQWSGHFSFNPLFAYQIRFSNPERYNLEFIQLDVRACYDASCRVQAELTQTLRVPPPYQPPSVPLTVLGHLWLGHQARIVHAGAPKVARVVDHDVQVSSGTQLLNHHGLQPVSVKGAPLIGLEQTQQSATDYFKDMMGRDKQIWKNSCVLLQCAQGCNEKDLISAHRGATCIWVQGDLDLAGHQSYGDNNHPLQMVVEGELNIHQQAILNGLVYLESPKPQIGGAASWQLNGALVVQGDLKIDSAAQLAYDAKILEALPQIELSVPVSGTWGLGSD